MNVPTASTSRTKTYCATVKICTIGGISQRYFADIGSIYVSAVPSVVLTYRHPSCRRQHPVLPAGTLASLLGQKHPFVISTSVSLYVCLKHEVGHCFTLLRMLSRQPRTRALKTCNNSIEPSCKT